MIFNKLFFNVWLSFSQQAHIWQFQWSSWRRVSHLKEKASMKVNSFVACEVIKIIDQCDHFPNILYHQAYILKLFITTAHNNTFVFILYRSQAGVTTIFDIFILRITELAFILCLFITKGGSTNWTKLMKNLYTAETSLLRTKWHGSSIISLICLIQQ